MVQQRRVTIITDSSSCLPRELRKSNGIIVVPHLLITDGIAYRDGIDIEPSQFYHRLQENKDITTSGPNPQAFLEAFLKASAQGDEILCLTLSPRFSASTFDSAKIAARLAQEKHPELKINVVDSQAAAGAEGLIALEAARTSFEGKPLNMVTARVEELIPRVQLLAFLDTLFYLGKSGKIPKMKVWVGSLLRFKPLTELSQGNARMLAKPRSRAKAMEQLIDIVSERMGEKPVHINIMHADAPNDAAELSRKARNLLNCHEIFMSEFTPVMGAHTGPGLLGLAFYSDC